MKKATVIVLAGQSNAVGVGHAEYLEEHFGREATERWRSGFENVSINYFSHNMKSGGFVPTAVGMAERGRDTFGPEIGIADLLDERFPGETFYIVKCAFGGMSLFCDWLSPSGGQGLYDPDARYFYGIIATQERPCGWCFNELVKILKESIEALEDEGLEPDIRAFMWMQGESDACEPEHAGKYIGLYDALLSDLKSRFGGYMKNCVFTDAGISGIWKYFREINEAKRAYASESPDRRYIDTIGAGLTTLNEPHGAPDIYHYDSDSTIKLGRLFAEYAL